ncbi:hypothetical protein Tco_0619203 [Tanacetum coccineum]
MVNVFPLDHVDDLLEVEPNQLDPTLAIPEPDLVDENEEPEEEEEFEDEEEFEEEEEDMESEDMVEVGDTIQPEDETVPNSVHEAVELSTATFLREDGDSLLPAHALVKKKGKTRDTYFGKLMTDLGNEVRCSMGEREVVLEDLIKEFGNTKERAECKKLKRELEEARGVVFKERPNKAIDVPVKDEESPSSEP